MDDRGDTTKAERPLPSGVGVERRTRSVPWLPPDFAHPRSVVLRTGHHLRPIREADLHIDYPAVMGSRERLWSLFGEAWGWPPEILTLEQDREELARHEREANAHESFNYAIFDAEETILFGCVYIDPPADDDDEADADIWWWVVDEAVGTDLEQALQEFISHWIGEDWPFSSPRLHPNRLAGP